MKSQEINEEPDIVPEDEVLEKVYEFQPSALCRYKQRGTYLVCTSCELQHAIHIGINKMMVGEDEHGQPILEDRTVGA